LFVISRTAAKKTQKKVTESFVGAKSKEFISESESSGSEDKPLKRKKKDSESDRAKVSCFPPQFDYR